MWGAGFYFYFPARREYPRVDSSGSRGLGMSCYVNLLHFSKKAPGTVVEWMNERAKPPLMFDKKDD